MVAPMRDLVGMGGHRRGIERRVADLHRSGGAVGKKIDRGDARAVVQRLGHLLDRVPGRIQDDDLDVAVHPRRQRLPVGDTWIDEKQFGCRRIRVRTGNGGSLIEMTRFGRDAGRVVRDVKDVSAIDSVRLAIAPMRIMFLRVHDGLNRRCHTRVEQEPWLQNQLHQASPEPQKAAVVS